MNAYLSFIFSVVSAESWKKKNIHRTSSVIRVAYADNGGVVRFYFDWLQFSLYCIHSVGRVKVDVENCVHIYVHVRSNNIVITCFISVIIFLRISRSPLSPFSLCLSCSFSDWWWLNQASFHKLLFNLKVGSLDRTVFSLGRCALYVHASHSTFIFIGKKSLQEKFEQCIPKCMHHVSCWANILLTSPQCFMTLVLPVFHILQPMMITKSRWWWWTQKGIQSFCTFYTQVKKKLSLYLRSIDKIQVSVLITSLLNTSSHFNSMFIQAFSIHITMHYIFSLRLSR